MIYKDLNENAKSSFSLSKTKSWLSCTWLTLKKLEVPKSIIWYLYLFRNVVKCFYNSGLLMDVLTTFGELTDEITNNRKYAKWKAAYIHNCLKNGETPKPGPQSEMTDEEKELNELMNFDVPKSNPAEPKVPPPSASTPSQPNFNNSTS